MLVFVIVAAAVIASLRNVAVPTAIEQRAASADLFGVIEEGLHGAEDLRANAGGDYHLGRFRSTLARYIRAGLRASFASRTTWVITGGVFAAGTVLSLLGGALLHQAGLISLGAVYLLFRYTSLLRDPLDAIAEQQQLAQEAVAGFSRICQLLALRPSIRDRGRSAAGRSAVAAAGRGGLRLSGAGRGAARTRPPARAGSDPRPGRTHRQRQDHLARLLVRLLEPTAGAIRVGGVDLRDSGSGRPPPPGGAGHPGRPAVPRHGSGQPHAVRQPPGRRPS